MATRLLLAVLASGLAGGCSGVTTVSELPATVTVDFGEEVRVADPALTVRFVEVVQDSRCPVGATCVSEGSVTLRFSVTDAEGTLDALILRSDQGPVISDGVSFRLVKVEPVPRLGTVTDPRDYQATLELTLP